MTKTVTLRLYELMYQTLGCQCDVEPFLGDILNENPECKYHNWLEDMFQDGEDTDRYVTIKEKSNT